MAFYFSSVTKALYDTDVFPVASLPANKVEISEAAYTELMTKQNQGYVILADGSGNPYTVNQSEASATDIKHAASVATTLALGHVKIGNTMTAANDGTLDLNDGAVGTSKLANGAVETSKLANDAVTADKVKDNETLPVNISGSADRLQWGGGTDNVASVGYTKLVTIKVPNINAPHAGIIASVSWRYVGDNAKTGEGLLMASLLEANESTIKAKILILNNRGSSGAPPNSSVSFSLIHTSDNNYELWGNVGSAWTSVFATVLSVAGRTTYPARSFQSTAPTGYDAIPYVFNVFDDSTAGTGSPATPVYVDSNGQVKPCDRPTIIDKIVNEDGTDIVISKTITINDSNTFYTLGKLNITPSDKERIVDFTFMLESYTSLDIQNFRTDNNLIFGVFVGNTEVKRFFLTPSVDQDLSLSFRCSFTANINNTIYIKVKRATTNEPHSADFVFPKVQGLIM